MPTIILTAVAAWILINLLFLKIIDRKIKEAFVVMSFCWRPFSWIIWHSGDIAPLSFWIIKWYLQLMPFRPIITLFFFSSAIVSFKFSQFLFGHVFKRVKVRFYWLKQWECISNNNVVTQIFCLLKIDLQSDICICYNYRKAH